MAARKKRTKQVQTARPTVPTGKRDPSREPYPSPYSEKERRHLDVANNLDDLLRATRKSEAAKQQIEGGRKLFVDPDLSDHSATATVLTNLSIVRTLAQWGEKFHHPRRLGALDDLGRVIKEIMQDDRTLSYRGMLKRLADIAGSDHRVVQEVSVDGETIWYKSSGKERQVGKRGLQDRMTRVRSILENSSEE